MSPIQSIGRQFHHFARHSRQFRTVWKQKGHAAVSRRARSALAQWISPAAEPLPFGWSDILAADLRNERPVPELEAAPGENLRLSWVMFPPRAGSGGHTTLFRMINYLEQQGYRNTVYFHDGLGGDHLHYSNIVRTYFHFAGRIRSIRDGFEDAHALIATSWPTAYSVFTADCAGKRFYFVQDFEPDFYPAGAERILAENTYRMDFHAITAGRWLTEKLRRDYDMRSDSFDFGCDTARYRSTNNAKRSGVAFYGRADTARRGYELGVLVLDLIARQRPDLDLHIYGSTSARPLPFRHIQHGVVSPERLNAIYNQCFAGLSLSFTNVSLVPYEMLASGCIPVVNDARHNRVVLDNPFIRYAEATPHALADAILGLASRTDFAAHSDAAARSVAVASWDDAGAALDGILRRTLRVPGHILESGDLR